MFYSCASLYRFASATKGQKIIFVIGPPLLRKLHVDGEMKLALELFHDLVGVFFSPFEATLKKEMG